MKKQVKPNLQLMLKSAISALQVTYKDYKAAIIEDLRCTWFSDDGDLTFWAGAEERRKKIVDLAMEVIRLQSEVDKIKDKIESEDVE